MFVAKSETNCCTYNSCAGALVHFIGKRRPALGALQEQSELSEHRIELSERSVEKEVVRLNDNLIYISEVYATLS